MRLPEFLTELSPVRETLAVLEQGENAMAEAVAEKNGQVCVETATGGLTLWERDYIAYLLCIQFVAKRTKCLCASLPV